MKTRITCPCGKSIEGKDEDELVVKTTAHLEEAHGRSYTPQEILFLAM